MNLHEIIYNHLFTCFRFEYTALRYMSFIHFTIALQFDSTCNREQVRLSLDESRWAQFLSEDFGSNSNFKFQICKAFCISRVLNRKKIYERTTIRKNAFIFFSCFYSIHIKCISFFLLLYVYNIHHDYRFNLNMTTQDSFGFHLM